MKSKITDCFKSLKEGSLKTKVFVCAGIIAYILVSLFIADKISFSLVDNKIYESCDFSEESIKDAVITDNLSIKLKTNNLTKLHLFYKAGNDPSNISIQFDELKNASYTIKLLEHTDSISYVEIAFYPSIKKQNGTTLNINVKSDTPVQFLVTTDTNEYVHKQYGFSIAISRALFICVFIFCMAFATLTIYLVKKCNSPHKLYFFIALVFGGINLFVSTPLGQPDAITHYESVYSFSNKILGIESPDGFIMKRKCDLDLLPGYYDENMRVADHTWNGTMKSVIVHTVSNFSMSPDCTLVPVTRYMTVSPRLEYLPQALLMSLGRVLGLNQFLVYFIVVFGNYLFLIFLISMAVKYSKDNYLLFVLLGLLPGILGIIQTVTYDGIVYSMSLLVISLAFYNFTTDNVNKRFKICSCIPALLLAPMKTIYFPISILLFISLFYKNIDYKKNKKVYLSSFAGVLVLFIIIVLRITRRYTGASSNYTVSYMMNYPVKSFFTFLRSLISGTDWFSYRSSVLFTDSFVLNCLIIYVLLTDNEQKLDIKQTLLFLIVYITIFLFIFCVAFSWTLAGKRIIYGLQNRYFMPIAPLLFIVVKQVNPCKFVVSKKISLSLVLLTCFITLMTRVHL